MINTIEENTTAQIVEKKSKFIADLFYIQSEEEAEEIINNIRKKYHDARHHCYAYSITTPDLTIDRMSDDGEPSGTAGSPMLNILQKKRISNVLIVVTRYFGGILLGTGGLVKAYTDACSQAIEKAVIVQEQKGYLVEMQISYMDFEKFNYYCNKNKINIVNIEYEQNVKCKIEVTKEEKEEIFGGKEDLKFNIDKYEVLEEKNIRKNIEK